MIYLVSVCIGVNLGGGGWHSPLLGIMFVNKIVLIGLTENIFQIYYSGGQYAPISFIFSFSFFFPFLPYRDVDEPLHPELELLLHFPDIVS